jgi:hypothetical protein
MVMAELARRVLRVQKIGPSRWIREGCGTGRSARAPRIVHVEVFNSLNRPNFLNPVNSVTNPLFGRLTSARHPRIMQVALMFTISAPSE